MATSMTCVKVVTFLVLLGCVAFYLYSQPWNMSILQRGSVYHVDTTPDSRDAKPKNVLVTGGAGFIGFHVSKVLVSSPGNRVVAMDNFNNYYDIKLKIDRAFELQKLGVRVYQDDLCNGNFLVDIISRYNITDVVHLAAQAGVRYSLENPLAYVRANIQCQITLLDALKLRPHIKLTYASSSSVYGNEAPIPFRVGGDNEHPGNVYAASKKTDELLGHHYCHAYGIKSVGLRFFTVYGPWGRPDMAVFKFAQAIMDGKQVPLFHVGSGEKNTLGRDFTYVDDIVKGVTAAMDYKPRVCGERFNLGFGNPVSVPRLLEILQKEIGTPAKIKKLPLPPSEILKTWADITESTKAFGFSPKIPLEEGVPQFISWYKDYRKQRSEEEASRGVSASQAWFKSLTDDRDARHKQYEHQSVIKHNRDLVSQIEKDRENYIKWARENGVEVPTISKYKFIFIPGMDSPSGDLAHHPDLKDRVNELKALCLKLEQCIAFNTDGVLKSRVQLRENWTEAFHKERDGGLYVAEIDLCEADLHDCSRYARCQAIYPAQYRCLCIDGYAGDGRSCLLRYRQSVTNEDLDLDHMTFKHAMHNLTEMKAKSELIFMQGLDFPGGNYMLTDQHNNDVDSLADVCRKDPFCVAVNTNGVMKNFVLPKQDWVRWTNDSNKGMLVFDINHCLLNMQACPDKSQCGKVGPADYTCICNEPLVIGEDGCVHGNSQRTQEEVKMREHTNNMETLKQLQKN